MAVLRTDINADTDIMRSVVAVPGVPLWTPLDLGSALAEWWNADDTADGAVATWTSRKGLAATATAGIQPVSAAASFNSAYRGLTADGVDDCFVFTTMGALPVGATAGEVWGVFSYPLPGSTAAQANIFRYGSTGVTSRGFQRVNISNISRAQASDGGATLLTDTIIDLAGPHIVGTAFNGTTETGRVDGRDFNPVSSTVATLATGTTRGRIFAGNGTSAGSFFPGVGRHVIVTTLLTQSQRYRLEGYLAWNSGLQSLLPANHPYKLAAPTQAWNPWDLDTALSAWWSADDHGTARMTDDGAGLISSWTDKVGGVPITAVTTTRPTWTSNAFNSSYAGITFDPVNNQCFVTTSMGTFPTGAVAGEACLVLSNTDPAATRIALKYGSAVAGGDRVIQKLTSGVSRFRLSDGTATLTDTSMTFDGPHIVIGGWSGTTQYGRADGADTNPASGVIATLATGTVRLRLGGNNGTSVQAGTTWAGAVRHFLLTLALTAGQRQQLEGWAAWDSGLVANLPAGHPYKAARP